MPHVINFDGPKTSSAVLQSATLNGAYGQAHDRSDDAALRLFKKDEFKLTGEGYETRWKKFKNTTKTFAQAGGSLGMGIGTVVTLPLDAVTGRGKVRPEGEKAHFMDEGLLGNGFKFSTALISGTAEVIGAGVGGVGAAVTYPAKAATGQSSAEWFEGGASGGAQAAGKATAHGVGTTLGVVLDVARVPSLATKVATAGVCAVAAGTIGVMAGTIRAIINH